MISRIRKYQCPNCRAYRVLPSRNKVYTCRSCGATFKSTQLDMTVWEDADGDLNAAPNSQMDEDTVRFMIAIMYIDSIGQELAPDASVDERRRLAIEYFNSVVDE